MLIRGNHHFTIRQLAKIWRVSPAVASRAIAGQPHVDVPSQGRTTQYMTSYLSSDTAHYVYCELILPSLQMADALQPDDHLAVLRIIFSVTHRHEFADHRPLDPFALTDILIERHAEGKPLLNRRRVRSTVLRIVVGEERRKPP